MHFEGKEREREATGEDTFSFDQNLNIFPNFFSQKHKYMCILKKGTISRGNYFQRCGDFMGPSLFSFFCHIKYFKTGCQSHPEFCIHPSNRCCQDLKLSFLLTPVCFYLSCMLSPSTKGFLRCMFSILTATQEEKA